MSAKKSIHRKILRAEVKEIQINKKRMYEEQISTLKASKERWKLIPDEKLEYKDNISKQ